VALANIALGSWGKPKKLFSFFERQLINPLGGIYDFDEEGRPSPPGTVSQHASAIAYLIGRPGADIIVDHGLRLGCVDEFDQAKAGGEADD
jgi:hypothetical protein